MPASRNNGDWNTTPLAQQLPGLLGRQPFPAAHRPQLGQRGLIDPGSAAIAVNTNSGKIHNRLEIFALASCSPNARNTGSPFFVRRNRNQHVGCFDNRVVEFERDGCSVKHRPLEACLPFTLSAAARCASRTVPRIRSNFAPNMRTKWSAE